MASTGHPSGRHPDDEVSFRELLLMVHRRRVLVLLCLLLGGVAGLGLLAALEPVYVARAHLLIEPERRGPGGATVASASETLDSAAVDSQVQILASRSLAREVIDQVGLRSTPAPSGGLIAHLLPSVAAAPPASAAPPAPDPVARFLANLTVKREGKSHVIAIAYRSKDPAEAAAVANAVAERYMLGQRARKQEAAQRQARWAEERLGELRRELAEAEQALAAFRAAAGPAGAGPRAEEMAAVSSQLVVASLDRAAKEAALGRLRRAVEGGEAGEALAEFGSSPLLANLSALKAETLRREAELAARYGERHPKLLDVRAEKAELDARLQRERRAVLRQLETELAQARAKEATLARRLEELKGEAARRAETERRAQELEHAVAVKRGLYEAQLARATEEARPAEALGPDARLISEAVPPTEPSFPNPRLILSLSLTGGLLLGFAALYLAEAGQAGLTSAREVEAVLGLPTLALVPRVTARRGGPTPVDYAVERPRSRYAEALRTLLASLARQGGEGAQGARPRVLLVTSSLPREGKSTLVASLARVAAAEGLRVIVVDADLRRPSLRELLGLPPGPGLIEVLRREVSLADALGKDPKASLRLLPGSSRLSQPTRLLGPEGLGTLLAAFRENFDLVLVDSAPLAAVADAKLLGGLVDAVLFAVRYRTSRREACAAALRELVGSGAPVAGAVLTQVDLRDHARRHGRAGGAEIAGYYAD